MEGICDVRGCNMKRIGLCNSA